MPERKNKKRKLLFVFIRMTVVVALILYMVYRITQHQRWSSFLEYLQHMNPLVFALALGIFIICSIIIGLRWWLLLKPLAITIKPYVAVKLYFLGWFYNIFMPGSVGGDFIRAGYATKHTEKKIEAFLSVFADRFIGLLSTLIIAFCCYLIFLARGGSKIAFGKTGSIENLADKGQFIIWFIAVVGAIFVLLLLWKSSRMVIQKLYDKILRFAKKTAVKLRDAIIIYCKSPMTILLAFVLTVIVQMLTITGFWILGSNMGIEVEIGYYFVFFTLTWVVGTIPISIGGAGVVEGALVFLFVQMAGLDEPAAWAIALSQRAVWLVASLPGAVIHLMGAHLPKDFFVDYNRPVS
jgi:uncharacterized protein (TIRG00374 family)